MKNVIGIVTFVLLGGIGCSTQKSFTDDMYFSLDDAEREYRTYQAKKELVKTDTNTSFSNSKNQNQTDNQLYIRDADGNIIIKNTYYEDSEFNFDDYYDYAYSARIRRFGNSWNTWNYYDPYYTNYYWYNPIPSNWGTSIYQTYPWWGPTPVWPYGYSYNSYTIIYSWGWNSCNNPYCYDGWGYNNWWYNPWHNNWNNGWWNPYDPWCYSGWNNPWYFNSWEYNNGYCNGYNQGYWNGFNNGMFWGNLYFNSFDNNSYYYGPRLTSSNTDNSTFSFSKMMQQNGIERDLVSSRIKDVPISSVDRGGRVMQLEKTILEKGQDVKDEVNTNRGNIQSDKFTSFGAQGIHAEEQKQGVKDVIIIRNYDANQGTSSSQDTRQNANTVPVNRNYTIKSNIVRDSQSNSIGNNIDNSNNTYRNWYTGGKKNFNIERKQEGGMRSGTFTEGSRTYQNYGNLFNQSDGKKTTHPIQQQNPLRGSHQVGNTPVQQPR